YFDPGTPNLRMQTLQLNYKLPLDKIPFLAFVNSEYSYTGDYSWQRATDAFSNVDYEGVNYQLGNTIQNANRHSLNTTLTMDGLYKYLGLVTKKKTPQGSLSAKPQPGQKVERNKELTDKEKKDQEEEKGSAALDALINLVTMVKTMN